MSFSDVSLLWWAIPLLIALGIGYYFSLVDRPTWVKSLSIACRAGAVLLLLMALARPFFPTSTNEVHVAFLVDGSASVSVSGMEKARQDIETSINALNAADSYSIILFAKEPRKLTLEELDETIKACREHGGESEFRSASLLGKALLRARLHFPADQAKRIVIYSDGVNTDAHLDEPLAGLTREGVDCRFNKIATVDQPEAAVLSFESLVPSAYEGEIVRMRGMVSASRPMPCVARLLHRGVEVQRQEISLEAGEPTALGFDVEMTTAGATAWTLEIQPKEDFFPANNSVSTTIQVSGEPRVLVLHDNEKEMRAFSRAMRKQGIELDIRGARGLPQSLQELLAFKAVILADVPATELTVPQMKNLKSYVSDFGGGLAMLGSENSFGLGGYYGTPIDEILPLSSRYEKEKQKPSLAMVLVIDKSGSMDGEPIALARQAAKAAVELMGMQDSIAVLGFDSNSQVIVEMTSAASKTTVQDAIDTLAAGGGTNLQPAMIQGKEMLERSPAKIKHMIILSDGQTSGGDYIGMAQDMAMQRMTVSTVALGDGAAKELMSAIAEEGKGRYYETNAPENMPQIFTKETMQASKSAIKEDIYASVMVGDHPLANGFEDAELPFVMGYVMTKPRPTATMLMAAETGDPLLAVSRYGLGTTMAYASDLTEKWGSEWLSWSAGSKFWSQAIRSLVRKENGQGIALTKIQQGDQLEMRVTRRDDGGQLVDGVDWRANGINDEGNTLPVNVRQTGVGSYAVTLDLQKSSEVAFQIQDPADGRSKAVYWARPYPLEYQLNAEGNPALQALPSLTPELAGEDLPKRSLDQERQGSFALIALFLTMASVFFRRI